MGLSASAFDKALSADQRLAADQGLAAELFAMRVALQGQGVPSILPGV